LFDHFLQPNGEREKGLASARTTDQRDDLDLIVEKELEGEPLLFVECPHPPIGRIGVKQRPEAVLEVAGKR